MSGKLDRANLNRDADSTGHVTRSDFHDAPGEDDAQLVGNAFRNGALSATDRLAAALSQVDSTTRARLVGHLQRQRGNTYVQNLAAESRRARGGFAMPARTSEASNASATLLSVQRDEEQGGAEADTAESRARRLYEQASRHYRAGAYPNAIRDFERARQMPGLSDSINNMLLYNIGMCDLQLNRFNTAISYFEQYLAASGISESDQAEARQRLAEARRGAGIPADLGPASPSTGAGGTRSEAAGANSTTQEEARATFERATQQYAAGDFNGAIESFETVQQAMGLQAGASLFYNIFYNIGMCNLKLRRYHAAVNNFEDYLAGDGLSAQDRAEARERLNEGRRGAGLPAETGPEEGSGGATGAASPEARARGLFERGSQHFSAGAYRDAIRAFERVRHLPGLSEAHQAALLYNIGMCNLRLNRFSTAITYFERYLATSGLSASDIEEARARLSEARRRAGVPVEEESVVESGRTR
ncbi:MAG: tetratricopeptide repeat protein [Chloroflexi bacterium]|nr:tetratricopeptide repeat protein [Chloroflexota bacterium]